MMSTEHNQEELGGGQTSRGDGTSFGTSCARCVLHVVVCVRAMYIWFRSTEYYSVQSALSQVWMWIWQRQ